MIIGMVDIKMDMVEKSLLIARLEEKGLLIAMAVGTGQAKHAVQKKYSSEVHLVQGWFTMASDW